MSRPFIVEDSQGDSLRLNPNEEGEHIDVEAIASDRKRAVYVRLEREDVVALVGEFVEWLGRTS